MMFPFFFFGKVTAHCGHNLQVYLKLVQLSIKYVDEARMTKLYTDYIYAKRKC